MPLPLTSALLDQILFAMEDQDNFWVLNLATRNLETCTDENACGDGTILPLPNWSSTDGFRMMREFSESLRNPIVQAELREVLDSGQGVFRRFKQILKPRDLLYRQWLRFKRRFMEEKVRAWIDQWPEVVFEDPADPAFDGEVEGLLASDFTVRRGLPSEGFQLEDWDHEACLEAAQEIFGEPSGPRLAAFFRRGRQFSSEDCFWVAENPQGGWAGVIWSRSWVPDGEDKGIEEVLLWFVAPEYRGLGLGTLLLDNWRTEMAPGMALAVSTPYGDRRLEGPLGKAGFRTTGKLWFAPGNLDPL